MDDLAKLTGDDSDSNDSSTDLDEYDTAEEYIDCNESYFSFDESSIKNEVLNDDYPDIEFIDEDSSDIDSSELLNKQQSAKTETEIDNDIVTEEKSHIEPLKDCNKYPDIEKSSSNKTHNSSIQLFDDQRELSIQEKISFFEKIGKETDKGYEKYQDSHADVLNAQRDADIDIKQAVNEEDSSDEIDSSAENETSYEDLLESLLEKDRIKTVSRKNSSGSEDFENVAADLLDEKTSPKDTEEKVESADYLVVAKASDMHDKCVDTLENESQRSVSKYFACLEHEDNAEIKTLNKESDNNSLKSERIAATAEQIQEVTNESNEQQKEVDPLIRLVELGVTHLNDLSHQKHLFCAKMGYAAGETRGHEMAKQEVDESVADIKLQDTNYETSTKNSKMQNKTFLLPIKLKDQVNETNEVSDHMINRQSSVIKDNLLTAMPFTDYSDSEILSDVKESKEKLKTKAKITEPAQEAVVRYVELGTASLLEGSHYKNLRCAKIVNPMISNKKSGFVEHKASSEAKVCVGKTENIPNIANISKSPGEKEDAIVPDVVICVTACNSSNFEKQTDTNESVESTESEREERDRNRKSTKSLRRRMWRHNAVVSDYVANIEQAESLRNSGVGEDVVRTESAEEELLQVAKPASIGHKNGNTVKDNETDVVRTVEIGTACLYEIPHLKYLHCAKMISPSS